MTNNRLTAVALPRPVGTLWAALRAVPQWRNNFLMFHIAFCFLFSLSSIANSREQKDCIFIWNAFRIIESHHRMHICNAFWLTIGIGDNLPKFRMNAHWDWLP